MGAATRLVAALPVFIGNVSRAGAWYNSHMRLSQILALLADDPDYPVDLARVALLVARDAYPHMHPRSYLRRIDRLAEQIRPRLRGSLEARTAALSTFLFEECGFVGNTQHYYDPR